MELVLIALAAGGSIWLGKRFASHRTTLGESRAELEGVRRLADEDVTLLGEELQRLDAEVSTHSLDAHGRSDYQRALDAYESAGRAVPRIRSADEISKITDTLSTGRYALACVQASAAGRPIPEHRVPCFFNPQHGPSVIDVLYTAPGRGTRSVPSCAQDAARVAGGGSPEVRKVKIGSRMVPYWEAGAAYLPYGHGYFAGSVAVAGATTDWAFVPPVETGGGFGGGGVDGGGGFPSGGFDGGFDGGGAGGGGG